MTAAEAPEKKNSGKGRKSEEGATEKKKVAVPTEQPPQPDKVAHDAVLQKLKDQDQKLIKKREEITAKIDAASGGTAKEAYDAEREPLLAKLNEIRTTVQDYQTQKSAIIEERKAAKKAAMDLKGEERAMQRDMDKTMSLEALDKKLAELEWQMSTKSMTLNEEKKLMQEMKLLKAQKPAVMEKQRTLDALKKTLEEKAAGAGASVDPEEMKKSTDQKLDDLSKKIDELRAMQDDLKAKLEALKEKRDKQMAPLKALFDERKALQEDVKKMKAEKDAEMTKWREANDLWYEWEKSQRAARAAKREAEDKQWNDLRAAQSKIETLQGELDNPHEDDALLIKQAIDFCKQFTEKGDEKEEKKEENTDAMTGFMEGAKVCLPKHLREDESGMGSKSKKGKKGQKSGRAAKSNKVPVSAEIFKWFDKLKMNPPLTVDDCDKVIEKLSEKLAACEEKLVAWKEDSAKREQELKDAQKEVEALEEQLLKNSNERKAAREARAAAEGEAAAA